MQIEEQIDGHAGEQHCAHKSRFCLHGQRCLCGDLRLRPCIYYAVDYSAMFCLLADNDLRGLRHSRLIFFHPLLNVPATRKTSFVGDHCV